MGFYRAGYEGPYDPFPHHWFCTQCGTKFHEDDPRILHPDGDLCSRRCFALWCAELKRATCDKMMFEEMYKPRWPLKGVLHG
jgi:hypothetical protein